MRFNIVSNITNGAGLERDYNILKERLQWAGHSVEGVMYDARPPYPAADVNIWLEVVMPAAALDAAPKNWLIPNPEWWYDGEWNKYLSRFERILCKTQDCYRIFAAKAGAQKCTYIGFESRDLYDPTIPKQPKFLHLAGKSETKNTAAVLAAWKKFSLPFSLTVAAWKANIVALCQNVPNVTLVNRFSEERLRQTMNECEFFVLPSKYEGFGHALHEAAACKAVIITTDAAPMNDFGFVDCRMLVKVQSSSDVRLRSGRFHEVSIDALADTVRHVAGMSEADRSTIGERARSAFLEGNKGFREAFARLIT